MKETHAFYIRDEGERDSVCVCTPGAQLLLTVNFTVNLGASIINFQNLRSEQSCRGKKN